MGRFPRDKAFAWGFTGSSAIIRGCAGSAPATEHRVARSRAERALTRTVSLLGGIGVLPGVRVSFGCVMRRGEWTRGAVFICYCRA